METDHVQHDLEQRKRTGSVLSGMSAEDMKEAMEAAATLKSLGGQPDFQSPRLQPVAQPYRPNEPEPILSLITSQYPLTSTIIHGSISLYKAAQVITPGGRWTEQNVALPLARHTARLSGVESGLRSFLQKSPTQQPASTPDVEKGILEITPQGSIYRVISPGEQLPPYNAGDRSPPYSENQLELNRANPPQAWPQRLIVTTSGLGVAMSDESIRSLKYCLSWLRWANHRLGGAVASLQNLLSQWDHHTPHSDDLAARAVLSARISQLKSEVLETLKQVVNIVSTYAGSALPDNAKSIVHSHFVTLPQRFSKANRRRLSEESQNGSSVDEAAHNANRALVLAQEGLEMMSQVTRVVNDTLVSAEDWCNRLGRRRVTSTPLAQISQPQGQSQQPMIDPALSTEKGERDGDSHMQM